MSTNPTQRLHAAGQSLWLDFITRGLLVGGGLARYIQELAVTGLTSNPTIFDHAIRNGREYDDTIRTKVRGGHRGETLFFHLAIEDLSQAADLLRPVHEATNGVDGWVSLELPPTLADDTAGSIAMAKALWAQAGRPNLFIKIPGTPAGLPAIEECIAAGVPINVTLLFSREQYLAAARAYLRGIERRIASGLNPHVGSVASFFVSRWDVAVAGKLPSELDGKLGLAVGGRIYKAYRDLLDSDRWLRLANAGARPQRLLFASTGTKDPTWSDTLYIDGLIAPNTINTMPENTLFAYADHGTVRAPLRRDGGDADDVLDAIERAGIDTAALALQLQHEGAAAFVKSWTSLLDCLQDRTTTLAKAG